MMNKEEATKYYIDLGLPTMTMESFYINVLTDEYFNQQSLYDALLIEGLPAMCASTLNILLSNGLNVTEGLNGRIINKSELLRRTEEDSTPYPINYTIKRASVKDTYKNIGNTNFPWLSMQKELVFLDVTEQQFDDKSMKTLATDNKANNCKEGTRVKQINEIIIIAGQLGYNPMCIPKGGKAIIKKECLKKAAVFTDSGFDHAWKRANKLNKISIENKEQYL